MARRARKPRGPKKLSYEFLPRATGNAITNHAEKYKLLDRLIAEHHRELIDARVALAWCTSWRPNVDGRQKLGQCRRASDLDRQLHDWDFVILLNREHWTNPALPDEHRAALLDHELCHATVRVDPTTLEPIEDSNGRKCYRLRQHDLEEFAEIAERYGFWKRDLETFDQALRRSKAAEQVPLPMDADAASVH